jgi:hypothetical protein
LADIDCWGGSWGAVGLDSPLSSEQLENTIKQAIKAEKSFLLNVFMTKKVF